MSSQRPTVLVVEDETLIRMGIVGELEDAGFTVLACSNADAAILLLAANPDISLLFTDIDMPGSMDGLKLAMAVRRRWPPVQIIVTSGKVTLSKADLPDGGRFIAKPYNVSAVAAAFREMSSAA